MVSLQRKGDTTGLAPYFQSLVLPQAEEWFSREFGNQHCGEPQQSANDCLGPRLAFSYQRSAANLPASLALTLSDLVKEGLTQFEAVNYTESCAGPIRIVPARQLVGDLTTTPVLSSGLSGLVQRHEPVYVLWAYNGAKETTLAFFVYAGGAFRYLGMPHPWSAEDLLKKSRGEPGIVEPVPPAGYLTNDQIEMHPIVIDPVVAVQTVVLGVVVGKDGKPTEVSYVRGAEAYKDAAIETVRKRKFDPPSFGPRGFHPNSLCLHVVVSH